MREEGLEFPQLAKYLPFVLEHPLHLLRVDGRGSEGKFSEQFGLGEWQYEQVRVLFLVGHIGQRDFVALEVYAVDSHLQFFFDLLVVADGLGE